MEPQDPAPWAPNQIQPHLFPQTSPFPTAQQEELLELGSRGLDCLWENRTTGTKLQATGAPASLLQAPATWFLGGGHPWVHLVPRLLYNHLQECPAERELGHKGTGTGRGLDRREVRCSHENAESEAGVFLVTDHRRGSWGNQQNLRERVTRGVKTAVPPLMISSSSEALNLI